MELCCGRGRTDQRDEKKVATHHTEGPKRGYDPASQLEAIDREGLDIAVLFRTSPLYADDSFEPEYALALCQAWNSSIADFCTDDRKRLKPSAVIPMHDVELAVNETRRAVQSWAPSAFPFARSRYAEDCSTTVISIRSGPRPKPSMLRYVFIRRPVPAANKLRNGSKAIPTIRFC